MPAAGQMLSKFFFSKELEDIGNLCERSKFCQLCDNVSCDRDTRDRVMRPLDIGSSLRSESGPDRLRGRSAMLTGHPRTGQIGEN